jgi:hypothetical protein
MKHPAPDIDPLLAARLAAAAAGERVEALLLLRGEARASLASATAGDLGATSPDLPALVRAALGTTAELAVAVRLFPALGALYVTGPVEFMRRLLGAPGIASATLPDSSE